jgi:hypothetical protein
MLSFGVVKKRTRAVSSISAYPKLLVQLQRNKQELNKSPYVVNKHNQKKYLADFNELP